MYKPGARTYNHPGASVYEITRGYCPLYVPLELRISIVYRYDHFYHPIVAMEALIDSQKRYSQSVRMVSIAFFMWDAVQ